MSESCDLDLVGARRQLEAAFAAYPARHPVVGCPCCVTPEDHQALAGGDLARFSAKALTTWGGVEDFKHFLPRLLDWLLEPATARMLEESFFTASGAEAAEISIAVDRLALLAQIYR